MPWTFVSETDGTTMDNIPDNVKMGDKVFLDELAKIRAKNTSTSETQKQTPSYGPEVMPNGMTGDEIAAQIGGVVGAGGTQATDWGELGASLVRGNPITGSIGLLGDFDNWLQGKVGATGIQDLLTELGVPETKSNTSKMLQFVSGFAPMGVPSRATPKPTEAVAPQTMTDLVKGGSGILSAPAKNKLAAMMDVNANDYELAKKYGFELPADVFSQNPQVTSTMGLARSASGSEARNNWENLMSNYQDKADELLKTTGVVTVNGSPSLPVISDSVLHNLTKASKDAIGSARVVFDKVDEVLPKTSLIEMPSVQNELKLISEETGGRRLYPAEKDLMDELQAGPMTYGAYIRLKGDIGKALAGQGPMADLKGQSAGRLYDALKQDQLFNVRKMGDEELAKSLETANETYAKGKQLKKVIRDAFKQNEQGGIGSKLVAALNPKSLSKDSSQFNSLMAIIPEDMQGQAISTAMASMSRMKNGDKTVFSPRGFVDMIDGIRVNPQVEKRIFEILPEGSKDLINGVYTSSQAVNKATTSLRPNGASVQFGLAMDKPNLAEALMDASIRAGSATAGGAVGNAVIPGAGGFIGSVAGSNFADSLLKMKPTTIQKMAKLFAKPEFQKLAVDYATGKKTEVQLLKMADSPEFAEFLNTLGIKGGFKEYAKWITGTLATAENSMLLSDKKPRDLSKKLEDSVQGKGAN